MVRLVAAITAMPHRGGPDHGDATSSWLSLARGQGMGLRGWRDSRPRPAPGRAPRRLARSPGTGDFTRFAHDSGRAGWSCLEEGRRSAPDTGSGHAAFAVSPLVMTPPEGATARPWGI